jgi:hypothetical protein
MAGMSYEEGKNGLTVAENNKVWKHKIIKRVFEIERRKLK